MDRDPYSSVRLTDREILSARHAVDRLRSDHGEHTGGVIGEMLRKAETAYLSADSAHDRISLSKRIRGLRMMTTWLANEPIPDQENLFQDVKPVAGGGDDRVRMRAHVLAAMVRAAADARKRGEDPHAILEELKRIGSDEGLADLKHAFGKVQRLGISIENVAWLSWVRGTSRTGRTKWTDESSGQIRYQETEPGSRQPGQQQESGGKWARGLDDWKKSGGVKQRSLWDTLGESAIQPKSGMDTGKLAQAAKPPVISEQQVQANIASAADHIASMDVKELEQAQQRLPEWTVNGEPLESKAIEEIKAFAEAKVKHAASAPGGEREYGKVYNVPTSSLHVDPARFQYKMNVNKKGVVDTWKNVKKFDPIAAGNIAVWHDPELKKDFVVNGHHRHELAERTGWPHLNVIYIQAANAKEARAQGALVNIQGGRGTAIDAAKYMRDSGITPEQLEEKGVNLKDKMQADAVALTNLNDRLFDRVARGTLDANKAVAVAKHLPDHELQGQLFKLLDRREKDGKEIPLRHIEEMAREMAMTPTTDKTEASLFGDITSTESVFEQRAELKAHIRQELAREANTFAAVSSSRRHERLGEAGNVLDRDKNKELGEKAEQLKGIYDTLVNRKGPISDAINHQAGELAKATTKEQKDAIKRSSFEVVRNAANVEFNRPPGQIDQGGSGPVDRKGGQVAEGQPGVGGVDQTADKPGRGDPGDAGLEDKSPLHGHHAFPKPAPAVPPSKIERMTGLTPEDESIEAKAIHRVENDYDALRTQYLDQKRGNATYDAGGNLTSAAVNTDEWRDLFEGYNGTNASAVHEPSSYANKKLLGVLDNGPAPAGSLLHDMKGKGNKRLAVYAGGGGSGKGTAIKDFFDEHQYPIRVDQVTDNVAKANKLFDKAIAEGFQPEYVFVDRPPVDAWSGVVGRAINLRKEGKPARVVQIEAAMKANIEARRAAIEILKTRPDAMPKIIDNTSGKPGLRRLLEDRDEAVAFLEKRLKEDESGIEVHKERLKKELVDRHQSGEIPTDIARGLYGAKDWDELHKGGKDERIGVSGREPVSGDDSAGVKPSEPKDDRRAQPGRVGGMDQGGKPAGPGTTSGAEGVESKTGPLSKSDYVAQAMGNLKKTSRTAGGVVDTSASKGKAAQIAEGLTGEQAAEHANANFERTINRVHELATDKDSRWNTQSTMAEADDIAREINKGIVKEGVLERKDDSTKFPYTAVKNLPLARHQFAQELARRLNDPNSDPVETAAWIEWRVNLTDHFYADGVGKTSKALAAIPLMRAGLPLPEYRDNKEFFAHASREQYDPNKGPESCLDGAWEKFRDYYKTLMPKAQAAPDPQDDAYNALPGSESGKIINADTARELHPEYKASREGRIKHSKETAKTAGQYARKRLMRELGNRGNREKLLILAGGPAAGKSSALDKATLDKADLVWDTTMGDHTRPDEVIDEAVKNGWKPTVRYIHADEDHWVKGLLDRADATGRWGHFDSTAKTHQQAQAKALELMKRPDVKVELYHNDHSKKGPPEKIEAKDIEPGGRFHIGDDAAKKAGDVFDKLRGNYDPRVVGLMGRDDPSGDTLKNIQVFDRPPEAKDDFEPAFKKLRSKSLGDAVKIGGVPVMRHHAGGYVATIDGKDVRGTKDEMIEAIRGATGVAESSNKQDHPIRQLYNRVSASTPYEEIQAGIDSLDDMSKPNLITLADEMQLGVTGKTASDLRKGIGNKIKARFALAQHAKAKIDNESSTDLPDDWAGSVIKTRTAAKTLGVPFSGLESHEDLIAKVRAKLEPAASTGGIPDSAHISLAKSIADKFSKGEPINATTLFDMANKAHGGTRAEGKYQQSQAYDALEAGFNLHLRGKTDPTGDLAQAQQQATELAAQIDAMPTQTNRTGNKDSFQQFSTPPHYAFAAAWLANIGDGEQVLEPSAGTGCLAIQAENAGGKVTTNELDKDRADHLRSLFGDDAVHVEDASQIAGILPKRGVKPSVVVMNPPFSQTAGRMGDKKELMTGANHIEEAMKMLDDNGRLVAIVGRGMTPDSTTFREWFGKMKKQYNIRASIGVEGKEYKKYGTHFGTRIMVLDKTGPQVGETLVGDAADIPDLMAKLEGVRNDRSRATSAAQQPADQSDGGGKAASGKAANQPLDSAPTPVGDVPSGTNEPTEPRGDSIRSDAGKPGLGDGVDGGRPGTDGIGNQPTAGERGADSSGTPGSAESQNEQARKRKGGRGSAGGKSGIKSGKGVSGSGDVEKPKLRPPEAVRIENAAPQQKLQQSGDEDSLFDAYRPAKLRIPGARPHPSVLVESSAMAAIPPPDPTYQPTLSPDIIEKGMLSEMALEAVVYAGQAHEQFLPAAEGGQPERRGYFIGDGTGAGKGREIAGIITDNFNKGRKKAVWVSEKQVLHEDAKRDWRDLGNDEKDLFHFDTLRKGKEKPGEGVCYITYDTMKGRPKDPEAPSNLDELIKWVGPDFDGVIAFDEAHGMRNAKATEGARGMTKPSQKALTGIALQKALPKARIVYVSATGASEVENLAYAERLGLWGRETPFATKDAFIEEMKKGGVAAMECVAQNLKAAGSYVARSLAYDDGTENGKVTYNRLTHELTPEQEQQYDEAAAGWQEVLKNIDEVLEITGGGDSPMAKAAAKAQFWGSQQRFFNQLMTAMQAPSVIRSMEKDIEDGHAPVIQIVNTMEAATKRALAKREDDEDLEDMDVSPKEILQVYLQRSFPVHRFETFVDDEGNERSRLVLDSEGKPVEDPQAVAIRDGLIEKIAALRIPESPLDMIINHFGHEHVAEATGRTQRVIDMEQDNGNRKKVVERRTPATTNSVEARAFNDGKKKLLIFSDAGGTGRSYHASKVEKNQKKRVHYLLQAGWRADKAVQGLGRTHRTNQASAPTYRLVEIDKVKAQRRFISTVARRLDQLGALTRGQRETGSAGLFKAADNLESREANEALTQFFGDLQGGRIDGLDSKDVMTQLGYHSDAEEKRRRDKGQEPKKFEVPPMTQFLNRLLSLKVGMQGSVFEAFDERLKQKVERATREGTLDVGVENFPAQSLTLSGEKTVYTEPNTKAEAKHIVVKAHKKNDRLSFDDSKVGKQPLYYVRNNASGRVWAVYKWTDKTDATTGSVTPQVKIAGPGSVQFKKPYEVEPGYGNGYAKIDDAAARKIWDEEYAEIPESVTSDEHFIAGAFLPIWNRLPGDKPKIYRLRLDDGRTVVGRHIPSKHVESTLKKLGVESSKSKKSAAEVHQKLREGRHTIILANGWKLKPVRVQGERRIEIIGPNSFHFTELEGDGAIREKINYDTRFFVPSGDVGPKVLERITKARPVVEEREMD